MKNALLLATTIILSTVGLSQAQANEPIRALKVLGHAEFIMNSYEEPGVTVYYSCSALIDRTKDLLKSLGATNVSVNCYGDNGWDRPSLSPTVDAKFASARLPSDKLRGVETTATWENVTLRGSQDCAEVRQLLTALAPSLELQGLKAERCFRTDSPYRYDLSVLVGR